MSNSKDKAAIAFLENIRAGGVSDAAIAAAVKGGRVTKTQARNALNRKSYNERKRRESTNKWTRLVKEEIDKDHQEWKARMIETLGGLGAYEQAEAWVDKEEEKQRAKDTAIGPVVDFHYEALNRMKMMESRLEKIRAGKVEADDKAKGPKKFKKKKERAAKRIDQQSDQNFLLQNLDKIIKTAPRAYQMPRLSIAHTKENLVNKLTTKEDMLSLLGASSGDISSLVPYIRFFKSDKKDGKPRIREFKFAKSSVDLEGYLKNGATGHSEIGLKSFDIKMTGTNSFTATRNFEGNLVLFFKSVADMDDSKGEEGELKWTDMLFNHMFGEDDADYLEDIAAAYNAIEASNPSRAADIKRREENLEALAKERLDILKKTKAEIYVEYGYDFSENVLDDTKAALKSAIKNTRMTLALYPITTNFTFGKDGSAELSVGFTAASEQLADDLDANILTLGQTETEKNTIKDLRKKLATKKKALENNPEDSRPKKEEAIQTKIDELEKQIEEVVTGNRISNYGRFIEYLYTNKRLFSVTVKKKYYYENWWQRTGGSNNLFEASPAIANELIESTTEVADGDDDKYLDISDDKWSNHTIGWFFLGDLLNYAAYALVPTEFRPKIGGKEGIKIPKNIEAGKAQAILPQITEVVLGDYIYMQFPKEGDYDNVNKEAWKRQTKAISVSLAQLPVSYSLYHSFMRDVIIKHSGTVMTFDYFLKKAVEKLIVAAMDSFVDGRKAAEAKRELERQGAATMIITRVDGNGQKLKENREQGQRTNLDAHPATIEKVDLGSLTGTSDIDEKNLPTKHIVIHGSRRKVTDTVGNSEKEDAERGIYHLSVGSRTGIVKDINFKQTSSRMKDINLQKQLKSGRLNSLDILSMPYDADVTIYGNPGFYPSQYLYLRPSYVGLGAAQSATSITRRLGLGGLYNLIGVSTRITPGTLETELTCIQNNSSLSTTVASSEQPKQVAHPDDLEKEGEP